MLHAWMWGSQNTARPSPLERSAAGPLGERTQAASDRRAAIAPATPAPPPSRRVGPLPRRMLFSAIIRMPLPFSGGEGTTRTRELPREWPVRSRVRFVGVRGVRGVPSATLSTMRSSITASSGPALSGPDQRAASFVLWRWEVCKHGRRQTRRAGSESEMTKSVVSRLVRVSSRTRAHQGVRLGLQALPPPVQGLASTVALPAGQHRLHYLRVSEVQTWHAQGGEAAAPDTKARLATPHVAWSRGGPSSRCHPPWHARTGGACSARARWASASRRPPVPSLPHGWRVPASRARAIKSCVDEENGRKRLRPDSSENRELPAGQGERDGVDWSCAGQRRASRQCTSRFGIVRCASVTQGKEAPPERRAWAVDGGVPRARGAHSTCREV